MDREKTMALVLLDLCAFACSQDNGNGARREFETACRLAAAQSLADTNVYRDLVNRLEKETVDQRAAESAFQVI